MYFLLFHIIFHILHGCTGQEMMGDGKSLMEQLRGEALKFHKPGEKETNGPNDDLRPSVHLNVEKKQKTDPFLCFQVKTTKRKATWSHQKQWSC